MKFKIMKKIFILLFALFTFKVTAQFKPYYPTKQIKSFEVGYKYNELGQKESARYVVFQNKVCNQLVNYNVVTGKSWLIMDRVKLINAFSGLRRNNYIIIKKS